MTTLMIKQPSAARRATGATLVLIGAFLALHEAGLFPMFELARSWPIFIIALALVRLGATLNARHRQGLGLLIMGDWSFANTMTDWAYLPFTTALLLAVGGVVMMLRTPRILFTLSDATRDSAESRYVAEAVGHATDVIRHAVKNRFAARANRYATDGSRYSADGNRYGA